MKLFSKHGNRFNGQMVPFERIFLTTEKSQTTVWFTYIGFQNNIFLHDHPEIRQLLTNLGSKVLNV